jgi:excisionase family DNA binding protein
MGANLRSVRELMMALLEEPLLSVDETAILLSLSRHSAYEGVKAGTIPSIKIGRCIKVPCSGLRAMLGVERRAPAEEAPRKTIAEPALAKSRPAAKPRRRTPENHEVEEIA